MSRALAHADQRDLTGAGPGQSPSVVLARGSSSRVFRKDLLTIEFGLRPGAKGAVDSQLSELMQRRRDPIELEELVDFCNMLVLSDLLQPKTYQPAPAAIHGRPDSSSVSVLYNPSEDDGQSLATDTLLTTFRKLQLIPEDPISSARESCADIFRLVARWLAMESCLAIDAKTEVRITRPSTTMASDGSDQFELSIYHLSSMGVSNTTILKVLDDLAIACTPLAFGRHTPERSSAVVLGGGIGVTPNGVIHHAIGIYHPAPVRSALDDDDALAICEHIDSDDPEGNLELRIRTLMVRLIEQ